MDLQINTTSKLNEIQLNELDKYSFWAKLNSIIMRVLSIIEIIIGIPLLLASGMGIFYIVSGIIGLTFSNQFMRSSKAIKSIDNSNSNEEIINQFYSSTNEMKNYLKYSLIYALVTTVLLIVILGYIWSMYYTSTYQNIKVR